MSLQYTAQLKQISKRTSLCDYLSTKVLPLALLSSALTSATFSQNIVTNNSNPSASSNKVVKLQRHEVDLLIHSHTTKGLKPTSPEYEGVARSQYMVATNLASVANSIIVYEGARSLMTLDIALKSSRSASVRVVQAAFPDGLPPSYDALNSDQKRILVEASAGPVVLYSGGAAAIVPAISVEGAAVCEPATQIIEAVYRKQGRDPLLESAAYRFFTCDFREHELALMLLKAVEAQKKTGARIRCCYGAAHLLTFGPEITNRFDFKIPAAFEQDAQSLRQDRYYLRIAELLAIDRKKDFKQRLEEAQKEVLELVNSQGK